MKAEQGIDKRNIVESYCKCSFRMIDEADLLFIVYGESYPLRYRYNTYSCFKKQNHKLYVILALDSFGFFSALILYRTNQPQLISYFSDNGRIIGFH